MLNFMSMVYVYGKFLRVFSHKKQDFKVFLVFYDK